MAYLAKDRSKTTKLTLILLAVSTLLSGIVWLILQFAIGSEKLGFPAVLSLFFTLFLLYGLVFLYDALVKKSVATSILTAFSFMLGILFVLIACKVLWWVILIICLLVLIACSFLIMGVMTKKTTIQFDNSEGSGYKTYAERKAEKDKEEEEITELPEIKSFKD